MKKIIIVTGAAGFIGSCIVAALNERNDREIIAVDHLPEPLTGRERLKRRNLDNKKFKDFIDKEEFLKLIRGNKFKGSVRGVMHMGACSSTLLTDAGYYQKNNFEYTRHLAIWCLSHNIRIIYASSAATYGDGSLGYNDDHGMIPQLKPLNLYGKSKQSFDVWALQENALEAMVGLKFFNVFGPNEYHKEDMRSVVLKAYEQILTSGVIRLFKSYRKEYKDGDQKRDFIYVKDAVNVVMHFWEHPELKGIYNVGTQEARTWNELALAIFAALNKKPAIEYFDMPEAMRPHYQYFTQANMQKLRATGYTRPFATLPEAVRDYVGYLKTNSYL